MLTDAVKFVTGKKGASCRAKTELNLCCITSHDFLSLDFLSLDFLSLDFLSLEFLSLVHNFTCSMCPSVCVYLLFHPIFHKKCISLGLFHLISYSHGNTILHIDL